MGNNIQIFGRTFSDVSSITVNNTFSSAVKYVQEPIFEDITISQDYLAKQNTVINNGIIFQTDETYPGTPVVINNAAYANIPNGDLGQNGTGIKIELNRTYHCTGELKIEWSTGEQEIYSIDSNFTPTNYNTSVLLPNFSWEGIGISTQTFQHMNLDFQSSSANGYKIFMRPTTANVITKSGVLLNGSYYQISVTSDGFNTINLNLSDDPKFQAIYKSLAYRSVIASSTPGVSEWCNSLSNIAFQQFAGQPFSGNFVFNNVSPIGSYAFGSVYANAGFANSYICNYSFPNCTKINIGTFYHNGNIKEVYFSNCSFIDNDAFQGCNNLTSINFPNCTSISNNAFQGCGNLLNINLPICTFIGNYAFTGCGKLLNINLPNCTYIGSHAFQYNYSLTTASFPNCTSIMEYAFQGCNNLKEINFSNCTYIGSYAFYGCNNLLSINFSNCTYIGANTFWSCSALTVISFPNCTSINTNAFRDCINLSSFYFMGSSIPSITLTTFSYTPLSLSSYLGYYGSIYVPTSLLASYQTAQYWSTYSSRMVGI